MIHKLTNIVQDYAWGSLTAIPSLIGESCPSDKPCAEVWMGAHPKAPSKIQDNGIWISLSEWIEKQPEEILGKSTAKKFHKNLPFLFKILAAAKPLSIQAHPSLIQAKDGFEKEERRNIPSNAANRNYKDNNHKPECICALTPFLALNGFRKISEIILLMEKLCISTLKNELSSLKKYMNSEGLKIFFHALMTLDPARKIQVIDEILTHAQQFSEIDPAIKWILDLHRHYPRDIGILSPLLLNFVRLEPGQAMFLASGELHAYLEGMGIELMANSDNVLRGGLTPKHIDVPELLKVVNFEERELKILVPKEISAYESVYDTPAEEFTLSVIKIHNQDAYFSAPSVQILLCTEGTATITELDANYSVEIVKGTSVIIPAAIDRYRIQGNAILYKASVPA